MRPFGIDRRRNRPRQENRYRYSDDAGDPSIGDSHQRANRPVPRRHAKMRLGL